MPRIAENLISAAHDGICRVALGARSRIDARCRQQRGEFVAASVEATVLRYPARTEVLVLVQEQHMSEQMISQAIIHASFGRSEELGQRLGELVEQARGDHGCLGYTLVPHDANCWALRGVWSSAETLQAHLQQPHLQLFQRLIGDGLIRQMALSSVSVEPGEDASPTLP